MCGKRGLNSKVSHCYLFTARFVQWTGLGERESGSLYRKTQPSFKPTKWSSPWELSRVLPVLVSTSESSLGCLGAAGSIPDSANLWAWHRLGLDPAQGDGITEAYSDLLIVE